MPSASVFQTTSNPPFNYQGKGARFNTVSTTAAAPSFFPTDITGCIGWFDASDAGSITASGGQVSQWNDKSGQANHVTQGTGSQQPITGTRTINSLNGLDFTTASSQFLGKSSSPTLDASSIFAVFKRDLSQTEAVVGSNSGSAYLVGINLTNGRLRCSRGTGINGTTTNLSNTVHQCSWTFGAGGGNTANGWCDAVQEYTNSNANVNNSTGFSIGCNIGANFFDGIIGEIIIYDNVLSAGNRQAVESYLKTKWGTP